MFALSDQTFRSHLETGKYLVFSNLFVLIKGTHEVVQVINRYIYEVDTTSFHLMYSFTLAITNLASYIIAEGYVKQLGEYSSHDHLILIV